MTGHEDLTGKKFGQLTVIKIDHIEEIAYWLCRCDCGRSNDFIVRSTSLKTGHTTSCKICGYERTGQTRFRDLTGQKFGQLTVIRLYEKRKVKHGTAMYWLCHCSCNRVDDFIVSTRSLTDGLQHACKLCGYEKAGDSKTEDLTGQIFGQLTVIKRSDDYIDSRGNHYVKWVCRCSCGKSEDFSTQARILKSGRATSCGCRHESFIASELKKYFIENYNAEKEYKMLKNPKTGSWLRCDIYIPSNKIFIEIHGNQHYYIDTWHYHLASKNGTTPEDELIDQKYRDKIKKNFAKKNGCYIEIDLRKIKKTEDAINYVEKTIKNFK